MGDKPNIWIKQFSAAETLGASSVSFLEAVDAVSIAWKTFLFAVSTLVGG